MRELELYLAGNSYEQIATITSQSLGLVRAKVYAQRISIKRKENAQP